MKQKLMQITEENKYSTKDIAKYIRQQLKAKFKEFKFSVVKESYSMGSSIHLTLLESPIRIIRKFEEITAEQKLSIMNGRNDTEEEVNNYIKQLQESEHYQVNEYHIDTDWQFTEEGRNVLKKILAVANKYNHDNSDPMTDYFDVNYYLHFKLGSWDKKFIDGV